MPNNNREQRRTNFALLGAGRPLGEGTLCDRASLDQEPPEIKDQINAYLDAIVKITDVASLREVPTLFKNQEKKEAASRRFVRAFAQRHRIRITDDPDAGVISYGITLENTRNKQQMEMSHKEVKDLIGRALQGANEVIDYNENQQTGLLRKMSNPPSHINEIPGWNDPLDLLLCLFSPKFGKQAKFEAKRRLVLMDASAEYLLYSDYIKSFKDTLLRIFNDHLFDPSQYGPIDTPLCYKTMHNPKTFAVEGVQILRPDDKYRPDPWTLYHEKHIRKVEDPDRPFYVEIRDEPKKLAATILKMIRKNTLDPAQIQDLYRMAITFTDKQDIPQFLAKVVAAGQKVKPEFPIGWRFEESTLDGEKYLGMEAGRPKEILGSSKKYQVYRVKLQLPAPGNATNVEIELSCYTLEASANHEARFEVNDDEYALYRQLDFDPEKVDGGALQYLYPFDVYDIDFQNPLIIGPLIKGIRNAIKLKAYSPNPFQKKTPVDFDEDELRTGAENIAAQIYQQGKETHLQLVVTLGPNSHPAARYLADLFGARLMEYDLNRDQLPFIEKLRMKIASDGTYPKILFLDDIAIEGNTLMQMKQAFPSAQTAAVAYKADTPESPLPPGVDYAGVTVRKDRYLIFPYQKVEHPYPHQSSAALIFRINNHCPEVLIQRTEKGTVKLPGGKFEEEKDDGTLDTLRRELKEEMGEDNMKTILSRILNIYPFEVENLLDPAQPSVPINKFRIRGYLVNGQDLDIDSLLPLPADPHPDSIELAWIPLGQAEDMLILDGYHQLIGKLDTYLAEQSQLE